MCPALPYRSSSPFRHDETRHEVRDAALVGPRDGGRVLGGLCAEVVWVRPYSDSPKVQPVRIPARLHCHVAVRLAPGVITTGNPEECEVFIGHFEKLTPQVRGKRGATAAMIRIMILVDPPGIVKHGEEPDDRQSCTG